MSVWDTVTDGVQQKMSDDMTQFAEDGNPVRFAGRQVGNAGAIAGNALGAPVGYVAGKAWGVLPEAAKKKIIEAFQAAAKGAMELPGVKETIEYVAENPVLARDVGAALNALELVPLAQTGKIINAVGGNMKTRLKDFYNPNPIKQQKGLMQEMGASAAGATKQAYSPQAHANLREKGVRQARIDEAVKPNSASTRPSNQVASDMIAQQEGKVGTLSSQTPAARSSHLGTSSWEKDQAGVRKMLKGQTDVPEEHLDALMTSIGNNVGHGPKGGKREKLLSAMSNIDGTKDTLVYGRNTSGSASTLSTELTGKFNGAPVLPKMIREGHLEAFKELRGGNMGMKEWKEFLNMAAIFETPRWTGGKGVGALNTKAPEGAWNRTKRVANMDVKDVPKNAEAAVRDKAHRVAQWEGGLQRQAPHGTNNSNKMNRTELTKAYLKVESGKGKMSKQDRLGHRFIKEQIAKNHGNIGYSKDGKMIRYGESYMSQMEEYANVGVRYSIRPDKDEIFASVLDGNDLMGMDMAGGKSGMMITPAQKLSVTAKGIEGDQVVKNLPKNDADSLRYAKDLEKKTGIEMRTTAEPLDAYVERAGISRNAKESIADFEKRAGVPRLKKETPDAYAARALQEYQAPVTRADRARATQNGLLTGLATVDSDSAAAE
jgi:hypothetical protein